MAHFSLRRRALGEPALEEGPGEGVERSAIGMGLEGGDERLGRIERAPGQGRQHGLRLLGVQPAAIDERWAASRPAATQAGGLSFLASSQATRSQSGVDFSSKTGIASSACSKHLAPDLLGDVREGRRPGIRG